MPIRRLLAVVAIALVVFADCAHAQGRTGGPPPPPATQVPTPPARMGTGFIAGRVLEGTTNRGVSGASVSLFIGAGNVYVTGTDAQGRFFFANLPDGPFDLGTFLPGYASQLADPSLSANPPRQPPLKAGERRTDITLRLYKQGALSGLVRDDLGDPVVGTDVMALRRVLANGRWALRRVGQARTDDRGAYRIASVDAGEYVLCACARDPIPFDGLLLTTIASEPLPLMAVAARALTRGADAAELDGTLRTYAPTFFGNSATVTQAARVPLASGEERSGLDITAPVMPATRVSGRITGGAVQASNIVLVPAANLGIEGSLAGIPPMLVQPDGRFDFAGVPPGQYVLRVAPRYFKSGAVGGAALAFLGGRAADIARPADAPGAPDIAPALWAEEPITVTDQGASNIVVTLRPTLTLSGRFVIEGKQPPETPNNRGRALALLQPAPPDPARAGMSTGASEPDGTFTVPNLVPGKYSVGSGVLAGGSAIKSITFGGADVTDLPIEIGQANASDLVITHTDVPMGVLEGTVVGAAPVDDEQWRVLIFPVDRKYWPDPVSARRRFRALAPGRDGTFAFVSFPAGDYFVVVERYANALDWLESSKLETLSRTAQRVIVSDGTKTTVTVKR